MALTNMLDWAFPQTIEDVRSPFNGEIKIVKFRAKLNLWSGGAEQSGELVEKLFRNGLLRGISPGQQKSVEKVLILGLGAGSILTVLEKLFPNLKKIVGVEIDPVIIAMGKKYFGLDKNSKLEIVPGDAIKYTAKIKDKFDLIILDCYRGKNWNSQMTGINFLQKLQAKLNTDGLLVLNLLDFYFPKEAKKLIDKIKTIFAVRTIKGEYDTLLFITCR